MEKFKKIIKECPIILGVGIGALVLTVAVFACKDSAYGEYAEETDVKDVPTLAVALKGARDGVYPWSEETFDSQLAENAAGGDDVIAEVAEISGSEDGDATNGEGTGDANKAVAVTDDRSGSGQEDVATAQDKVTSDAPGEVQDTGSEQAVADGQEQKAQDDNQDVADGQTSEDAKAQAEGHDATDDRASVDGQVVAQAPTEGQEQTQVAGAEGQAPADGQGEAQAQEQAAVTATTAVTAAEPAPVPVVEDRVYNFTSVGEDYFNDALFIGDSRTVGLSEYCKPLDDRAKFYAKISMSIYDVFKKKFISSPNGKIGLEQALSENSFGKIYIMLGLNEIGTGTDDYYRDAYKGVIDKIRELQPGAIIYIQGTMHVTANKSNNDKYFNNDRINARNAAISTLADQKYVFYIDMNPAVDDENGNLMQDLSFDDVHLKAASYQRWYEYLLNHAIVR